MTHEAHDPGDIARQRDERRQASIAATHKPDPKLDEMRRQYLADRETFAKTYGPHGFTTLGYADTAARAAGTDPYAGLAR